MALLVLWTIFVGVWGLDNGLARKPPMGWANWNGFGCHYNDTTIRDMADALVSTGMRDAGYTVLIIQECIVPAGHRNAQGVLQPDPVKFPHGMKNLVDYIHSKGLKAGIYTDVGPETCAGYEGSYEHDVVDAKTFAEWGIDFVEEDSCHHPKGHTYKELYGRMRDALNSTGRPIIFYSCVQGQEDVYEWGTETANLWRTTGDICSPGKASWNGVVRNFYGNAKYPNVSGPGHWQDPDMLVVGMEGLTEMEWKAHFSLWAMSAAPLWSGIDLTKMPASVLSIFLNKDVIAVDQDPLGHAAHRVASGHTDAPIALLDCVPGAADQEWTLSPTDHGMRTASAVGCLTVRSCNPLGDLMMYPQCFPPGNSCKEANQQFTNQTVAGKVRLISELEGHCVTCLPDGGCKLTADCTVATAQWTVSGKTLRQGSKCLDMNSGAAGGEVWGRTLQAAKGESQARAIALFNPGATTTNITVHWDDVGLKPSVETQVLDLWSKASTTTTGGKLTSEVASHAVVMLRFAQ